MSFADVRPGRKIRASHITQLQELVGGFQDQLDALPGVDQLANMRVGKFNPLDYGAVGDGVTDDVASMYTTVNTARNAYLETGVPSVVTLTGDRDYAIGRRITGSQVGGGIWLPAGVSLEGNGASIRLLNNCNFIEFKRPNLTYGTATTLGSATASATITGDVALAATQFTVDDTSAFAAADEVFVRLNDNAWDANEAVNTYFAIVVSIDSATTMTLDRPAPAAMTVADTETANRKIQLLDEPIVGSFVRNLELVSAASGSANAEAGIGIGYTRNVLVENIVAEHVGAGILVGGYSEGLVARNLRLTKCTQQSQGSKGRALNIWNAKNAHIDGLYAERFEGTVVFIESYCANLRIDNLHLVNNYPGRTATLDLMQVVQGSDVHFGDVLLEGIGGAAVIGQGGTTGNTIVIDRLSINTASAVKATSGLSTIGCLTVGETAYQQSRRFSKTVRINASTDVTHTLPSGIYRRAAVYASDPTGITAMFLKYGSTNGSDLDSLLVAGQSVRLSALESFGTDFPFNGDTAHSWRIVTDGTVVAGSYLTIDIDYWPSAYDDGALGQIQSYVTGSYTVTNGTTDRSFDADATSDAEIADVLATLISDLKIAGVIQ